jgi:hypothetical protein
MNDTNTDIHNPLFRTLQEMNPTIEKQNHYMKQPEQLHPSQSKETSTPKHMSNITITETE